MLVLSRRVFCCLLVSALLVSTFEVALADAPPSGGLSVADYGAIPNDGQDDSAAIIRCRIAAMETGAYHVHFPAGEWTIASNNVLHSRIREDGTYDDPRKNPTYGIRFSGEGQNRSILKLVREAGKPRWFYDSDPEVGGGIGWNRIDFADLWFDSDMPNNQVGKYDAAWAADTNGFRLHGTGVDKGFTWWLCRFNGLGTPWAFVGTANADQCTVHRSYVNNCGTTIIGNDNSLLVTWQQCSIWTSVDMFHVVGGVGGTRSRGGAGAIALRDCDLIINNVAGDKTDHYTLRIDDGVDFYRVWLFDQCRWELRGPEAKLHHWVSTKGSNVTCSHIAYRDCDLSVAQHGVAKYSKGAADPQGRRNIIVQGMNTRSVFERCYLPTQLGIAFEGVVPAAQVGLAYQPTVELLGCGLPVAFLSGTNDDGSAADATRGLAGRITLSKGFGRVRAVDCFLSNAGVAERMAVDFDYGGTNAARGEPGVQRHRVYLKASVQGWPNYDGEEPANERTILLPEGARIVAAGIDRPAGKNKGSTPIQYRIGSNDKSTTYCASETARADGVHKGFEDQGTRRKLFPIRVGSSLNLRRVRLWMGPMKNNYGATGGEAWIEYE